VTPSTDSTQSIRITSRPEASGNRWTILQGVDPCLRIDAVSVQLFYADYQGLFYEPPSAAIGILELALDDTWLWIITDVPNYADFHGSHCVVRPLIE
jgi:hypothetical protein